VLLPPWLRDEYTFRPDVGSRLRVRRLRGLVEENLQRRPNGTLYKPFWALMWSNGLNRYEWTINKPQPYDDVLAFAEVGARG